MPKKKRSDFTFIEDEIRLYPKTKRDLADLLKKVNDIIHSTPVRDDNGGGKGNLPSRPVENMVIQIIDVSDARIYRMEQLVTGIETAFNELDAEKRRIFDAYYYSNRHWTNHGICEEFHIANRTWLRWRRAFVLRVAILTGDYRG